MRVLWPAILCLSAFVLTACDEEVEEPEGELIRSIKYMALDQRAGLQDRRIAGIVAAAQTTNIAFETLTLVVPRRARRVCEPRERFGGTALVEAAPGGVEGRSS